MFFACACLFCRSFLSLHISSPVFRTSFCFLSSVFAHISALAFLCILFFCPACFSLFSFSLFCSSLLGSHYSLHVENICTQLCSRCICPVSRLCDADKNYALNDGGFPLCKSHQVACRRSCWHLMLINCSRDDEIFVSDYEASASRIAEASGQFWSSQDPENSSSPGMISPFAGVILVQVSSNFAMPMFVLQVSSFAETDFMTDICSLRQLVRTARLIDLVYFKNIRSTVCEGR